MGWPAVGASVGRGGASGVFVCPGVEVAIVRVAATFASTVASTAVSASRVLRRPASTVAGTSGVGEDAVCVSAGDGASLEQATAARLNITKTIRMAVLIIILQCIGNFQSSPSPGSAATGAHEDDSPAGGLARPGSPSFPARIQSLPIRLRRGVRTRGWPAQCQGLRAMLQHWARVLACVAEIPEVSANYILCSHCRRKPANPNSVVSGSGAAPGVAPGCAGTKGVGTAPAISWALAHRYTPPAVWRPASHPLPAVPAQWPLTRSSSPAQDSVPRSRPR